MTNNIIIIGIAGASGSGKTLIARTIYEELGSDQVVIIEEDSYYKDLSEMPERVREKMNFDHPEALDHHLLLEHLKALQNGKSVNIPIYDYTKHCRKKETRKINKHSIIVLEGILIFSEEAIRQVLDIKIFVDTPLDICLLRRVKRDVHERERSIDSILKQYEETVRPMYLQFIEPSKRYADLIVPRGGKNRIAIDLIKTKMTQLLEKP
jgi:uridine kinase